MSEYSIEHLTTAFTENRERLTALVAKNLNPILLKRYSHEDILSMVYEAAAKAASRISASTRSASASCGLSRQMVLFLVRDKAAFWQAA